MEANNMKAMREALVELVQFTCNSCQERFCESDYEEGGALVPCSAILKARDALAAPPRNCDRFATVDEACKAHEEYCSEYIMRASNKFDLPMEFYAWIFALAAEKEGGSR